MAHVEKSAVALIMSQKYSLTRVKKINLKSLISVSLSHSLFDDGHWDKFAYPENCLVAPSLGISYCDQSHGVCTLDMCDIYAMCIFIINST